MWKHGIVAILLAVCAAPAMAGSCPTIMGEIDELLNDDTVVSSLGNAQLERVRELREKGGELHRSGAHGESVDTLNEALGILQGANGDSGASGYSY
jgi:hypothetical protein